ncbi:Bacterial Ig-like domain (group 2) [compost metagenome]
MIGLKIVPVPASVALGHTLQFFAAALLSDGSYKDVSDSVYWSSNSTNIASIDRVTGLALGIAEGTATIIAEMQDGSLPNATIPLMVSSSLPNFDLGCTTGMVTDAGGKVWTCPLTYDEAVLFDIPFDDEYQENGKWYVMMSWQNASSYCANLGGGYYLPSKDELRGLWNEFGNMEIFAGWPTAKWYWTSTATSDTYYNIVRLSDGYINSDIDFKTHYVSCVRTGP